MNININNTITKNLDLSNRRINKIISTDVAKLKGVKTFDDPKHPFEVHLVIGDTVYRLSPVFRVKFSSNTWRVLGIVSLNDKWLREYTQPESVFKSGEDARLWLKKTLGY